MTSAPRSLRLTPHQRQTMAALAEKLDPVSESGGAVLTEIEETLSKRAKAILMMESGRDRAEICRELKLGHTELTRVRHRFLLLGLSGLHDVSSLPPYRPPTPTPVASAITHSGAPILTPPRSLVGPNAGTQGPLPASISASASMPSPRSVTAPASATSSSQGSAAPRGPRPIQVSPSTAMPHLRSDKMNAANAAGRFQALRACLGISRPQLAQWLGVTRQYITKIEGGMPPSKPVMLLVERLEQEARQNSDINGKPRDVEPVSRGFALAGAALENLSRAQPGVRPNHGTVHPASAPQSSSAAPTHTSRANGVQLEAPVFAARSVPLLAMHEAADLPSPDHAAHHGSQHLAFVVEDEQAFAVRITGEAMAPHYPEGSIAIVCPGLASRNGDLVLARLKDERGGGTMLRLVHFIQDGESLVLTSTHAAYPPLTVQKDDLLWLAPVTVSLRHLR